MNNDINRLCQELQEQRDIESAAKEKRTKLEETVAALIATKPEGTEKLETCFFKITVTSKLTRELDYPAYKQIEEGLPVGLRCVTLKPSLDLKALRALELADPSLPAFFITTKPAKATVKIEPIGEA